MNVKTYKRLSSIQRGRIEAEVRLMLHSSRDCLRNQKVDTTTVPWDVRDGYYGEAFGVMRALRALGYGDFGSDNIPNSIEQIWNLKWWFAQIQQFVLEEENFHGTNHCEYCLDLFGRDAVRQRAKRDGVNVILAFPTPHSSP